jgi:hypothetical protein
MKKLNICKVCKQDESHHHEFQPVQVPDTCICDIHTWGSIENIRPVCSKFEQCNDPNFPDICNNCDHDKGCHTN